MKLWRSHPGCQPGDDGEVPFCRRCGAFAKPVQDGQGPQRYDCPRCEVRFDLSRDRPSLETVGLSGWKSDREGYQEVETVPKVLRQRNLCGKTGAKLRCSNCNELTYVPFRCGTRICPQCARYQADQLYFEVLSKIRRLPHRGSYRLRHLTLTLKGSGRWEKREIALKLLTLARSLPSYYRDYLRRVPLSPGERQKLGLKDGDIIRDLAFWRKRGIPKDPASRRVRKDGKERFLDRTGLVAAMEVGPSGNVHVHCLYYGPFRWQPEMSAVWKSITGDSFIVDVRSIKNREKAVREITKYVVKFSELDESRLVELSNLLEPFRRVRTYGAFLGVPKEEREPGCWYCEELGCLEVIDRDIAGERWRLEYSEWETRKSNQKRAWAEGFG